MRNWNACEPRSRPSRNRTPASAGRRNKRCVGRARPMLQPFAPRQRAAAIRIGGRRNCSALSRTSQFSSEGAVLKHGEESVELSQRGATPNLQFFHWTEAASEGLLEIGRRPCEARV